MVKKQYLHVSKNHICVHHIYTRHWKFNCTFYLLICIKVLVGVFNHVEKYNFVNGVWDYPIYEMENNPNVWNHQSANPTELKSPSPSSNPSSLRADSSTWMQLVIRDTYFGGRRPDLHSRLLQPIVGQWWPGEIDDVTSPLRQSSSTISGMFGEYLPWFTYNCVITIKPSWHRPI